MAYSYLCQMRKSPIRIQAPLMPIAVSLMAGIAVSEPWTTDWTVTMLATSVVLVAVCLAGRWPRMQRMGIWLLTAMVGLMWGSIARQQQQETTAASEPTMTERVRQQALSVRQGLLDDYRRWGLSDDEYGVIAAMTLGDKTALTKDMKARYAQVGASHVLALSGLHLMIIYAVISLMVGWWRWRMVSQVATVLAVWAFAFLVGLSPSVVRSAFMISVYALASLGYRERMSVNTLAFTAIVMLAVNPLAMYDIGFQLSFMAVLWIVLLNPLMAKIIPLHVQQRHRWLSMLWGMTTVSVSAQVGTAPLVAYYFGRLPVYFLLSNYIVIPAATLILYLALASMMTGWWTALQHILVGALATIVSWMNGALGWIAQLPKSSVEGLNLSTLQVCLIYLLTGALWVLLALATNRKNVEQLRES